MKNIVRYFHQSLSLKLSIGVLLMTALIFFATLGIVFVESRRNIRQESIEHAASVLNNVAQNISRYLNTVETATNANAWMARVAYYCSTAMLMAVPLQQLQEGLARMTISLPTPCVKPIR